MPSSGRENEDKLVGNLSNVVCALVVSTNAAVHRSLVALAPSRLAVLTPYIDDLTDKIRKGVERMGITVSHTSGMGLVDPFVITEVAPEAILEFAERELDGVHSPPIAGNARG